MAFIELMPAEEAAERLGLPPGGEVHNYDRLGALHPEAYAGWAALIGAIRGGMDLRRYELATVAATKRLGSSHCSLAHGKVLAERFYDPNRVRAIFSDRTSAGLDEVDVAVMDLAEKVAADATSVKVEDVRRLLALGLSEREVLDVVLTAAARCFFSKLLDAMGVAPDGSYRRLDGELVEALTVGRPIEEAGAPQP
jgi:alkylhydroperoxidase family enzyme